MGVGALTVAAFLSIGLGPAPVKVPQLALYKVDFFPSYPVTDAGQFYRTETGQPLPAGDGKYPAVEFDVNRPATPVDMRTVPYVVQRRGNAPMFVDVTWYNPMSYAVTGTWQCEAAVFVRTSCSPPQVYPLGAEVVNPNLSIPATGTATRQLILTGYPDFVCSGTIYVAFSAVCPPLIGDGEYYGLQYQTDEAPTGWMSTPWAEVLTDSCKWSDGRLGRQDILKFSTKGLFSSSMFTYDPTTSRHIVLDAKSPDEGKFYLSDPAWASAGDCRDISSYLTLATTSLGQGLALKQVYTVNETGVIPQFRTNSIKGIGLGSYGTFDFWFHQFAVDGTSVFDASSAHYYGLDGAAYLDVPIAWPQSDFWQKPLSGTQYVGLTNGLTGIPGPLLLSPTFGQALIEGPKFPNRTTVLLTGVR